MDIEKTSCLTDCVQLSNELSNVIEFLFFSGAVCSQQAILCSHFHLNCLKFLIGSQDA